MNAKNRVLSVVMAILLSIGLLPVGSLSAFAAGNEKDSGVEVTGAATP